MLPPNLEKRWPWERHQKGHLYIMGQRVHYESRKEWNTVSDLNIWIWRGFKLKDRDRGMVRLEELKKEIIPLIVNSMLPEDLKKSIYDFKILWDNLEPFFPADYLLKEIVEKLASAKITLEFEEEYLANDLPSGALWIGEALISQGFKLCRPYLKKVGMKSAIEQFKEWQKHNRIEVTPEESKKIEILQKAARAIGLPDDEIKEVWVFSAESEKNIVHGQYNPMFYWMAREALNKSFLNALHVYIHQAAHSEGSHGDPKFDYALQSRIQKIQKFILEHPEEWKKMEEEWNSI